MDTLDPRDDARRQAKPAQESSMPPPATPMPAVQPQFDPWNYRPDSGWSADYDIVGYHVEATDGSIGKIDESSHALDESYLVVDTGHWIFGKRVVLPAGTVTSIDHEDRKVYVDRTKAQIKSSPEFDPDTYTKPHYRDEVGGYYRSTYDEPAKPADDYPIDPYDKPMQLGGFGNPIR